MSDPDEKPEQRDSRDAPDTPWWSTTPATAGTDAEPHADTDTAPGADSHADSHADSAADTDAHTDPGSGTEPDPARDTEYGRLVAGPGVPSLDTRGAVPAEPVTPLPYPLPADLFTPGPRSTDTDPDGIPVLNAAQDIVPPPAPGQAGDGRRRLVMIGGGGVVVAALVAAIAFAGPRALSGPSDQEDAAARSTVPAGPRATGPTTDPGKPAVAPSIDDERTDPRPLLLRDVFPARRISLGGHPYTRDLTAVNRQCELTARGAMAAALERGRCRGVVRATFTDGAEYAVTAGVAIMPTGGAAMTASRAGDPSRYEWFRGMRSDVATGIDQAGGYAASTVRGRYIVYAYAQYADGTRRPRAADPALKALAHRFIAYAARPIDRRAG